MVLRNVCGIIVDFITTGPTCPPTTVYIASPFLTPHSLPLAFEDGTDTWFRNVDTVHIDAGEIPKRTFTICGINSLNNGYAPVVGSCNGPLNLTKAWGCV
jgi:hypothetical protein